MSTPYENFSLIEFKTLVLIHAADIDYEFHQAEKEYIISLVGPETFMKMMIFYSNYRSTSYGYILEQFQTYLPTETEREIFKMEVFNLFLSDKIYNNFEKAFMEFFRDKLCVPCYN